MCIRDRFGGNVQPYVVNFLKILCERRALSDLDGCVEEFCAKLYQDVYKRQSYDTSSRQEAGMDAAVDAAHSFRDAHKTLTEEQVRTETARCLGCGASVVDPNKCIGCGICTTKCEFDAIHLHRDLPECSKMVRSEDKFKAILPYMLKRCLLYTSRCV